MAKKVWVIMADQLSFKYIACNGYKPWMMTPNLDHLAAQSVNFQRTYCSSPLCIPSRMSFYTGRNTRHHLCICDHKVLTKPTIFQQLRQVGVASYAIGKLDFRDDNDQSHGITERPGVAAGAQDVFPGVNNFSSFIGRTVTTIERETDEQCEAITATSLECLARPGPSLIFTSYVKPHDSWDNGLWFDAPKKFWDLYRKRRHLGLMNQWEWGYAANVSLLDHHVGKCINTAKKRGLLEDALIIFTGDHGEMAGAHGLFGKHCMYEEAIRVPLMMLHHSLPPKQVHDVSALIDVFPTVFHFLGLRWPTNDGISLLSHKRTGRHVFVEVFNGQFGPKLYRDWDGRTLTLPQGMRRLQRCIVTDDWKLVHDGEKSRLFSATDESIENHDVHKRLDAIMDKKYHPRNIFMNNEFKTFP